MRNIALAFNLFFVFTFVFSTSIFAQDKNIYFFYGSGCPHCAVVEQYFENSNIYSKYKLEKKEIYSNKENALFFNEKLADLGVSLESRGVPTVIIGEMVLMGDRPIIEKFEIEANKYIGKQKEIAEKPSQLIPPVNLTLPTIIIGALVDAINPCEFAVLIILMTTVLATGDKKRAFASGLAFSASIFISYFLMGLGLYKALSIGSATEWFLKVVGVLAILLGLANLKDYFWYGKGFLMEVPMSWRPNMKKLIYSVTSPKGAFLVGFLVSLFLLPCTSGPYIVILGMLAKKTFDAQAVMYLLLYNLIFVSPMLIISWAVYKGYDPTKAEATRQKQLRTLHLIAGLVMMAMGGVILVGWL